MKTFKLTLGQGTEIIFSAIDAERARDIADNIAAHGEQTVDSLEDITGLQETVRTSGDDNATVQMGVPVIGDDAGTEPSRGLGHRTELDPI